MKPISIKIDTSLPEPVREGWVKAFQQECFDNKITWNNRLSNFTSSKDNHFSVSMHKELGVTLFLGANIANEYEEFTLPQDWQAFKIYLQEYIAYHSKPEPKVGEYWKSKVSEHIFKITKLTYHTVSGVYSDGSELFDGIETLERPATDSEIQQFQTEQKENENKKLLEECERKYPDGTKFISAHNGKLGVSTGKFIFKESFSLIEVDTNSFSPNAGYTIYLKDKDRWAEIIKEEEPNQTDKERIAELEEALRDLTKYHDPNYKNYIPEFQEILTRATKLLNQPKK